MVMPKTLSASSLNVAKSCMARYIAENIDFTPQPGGIPAMTGTSFHGAAEQMVAAVYLQEGEPLHGWELNKLLTYYKLSYVETFGHSDFTTDYYKDGYDLCIKWFNRTDLSDVKVLDVEKKKRFPLVVNSDITIPVTYIFDRIDYLGDNVYKVVDYKTIRKMIRAGDLKKKIQPRLYALAAQLEFPDAEKIWVEFDMIRHDPIGVVFTKDENRETYKYLRSEAVRILNTKREDVVETINPECGYCVRRFECDTLIKHAAGGGVLGMTPLELATRKHEVSNALKALSLMDETLDEMLARVGEEQKAYEFEVGGGITVEVTAKAQRSANPDAIRNIIGPELTAKYGNITMGAYDQLMKSDDITAEQKAQLKEFGANKSFGKTKAIVKMPNDLEDL